MDYYRKLTGDILVKIHEVGFFGGGTDSSIMSTQG
jgi:hypothetical protein